MRDVADFPSLLQSFFTTRLMTQRRVSPHTIASYRDTFRLLLQFAQKRVRKAPSQLSLEDLNASLIGAFLDDLGDPAWQRCSQPELAADSGAVFLPLRRTGSTGARRTHPTCACDSEPATASRHGGFSNPAGNRCAAGSARPGNMVGTSRSRLSAHRRSDWVATV